ncbi:H-NS family nucleoid-associated regulatory protein [Cereibacter sphaeroides]|uniref:H-NS histone family protein n=1 Tax=Cereibacter sphaeroides TaxID=1063 RepID=UPI001F42F216|nr:H-NS histone family protein [Cereibacter sphaeroides]MCE6949733.1 H-NS histone family protein [Cereibacter sphaeroides]MCE6967061.1 H-NS histone family protein [Cereibacter sphaeroides]
MPDIDLKDLSLKELKVLQAQVIRAIATFDERRKKAAREELEERARELGFSLAELTGTPLPRRIRARATPKYANPANSAETWSGRGRRPRWFGDAMSAGNTPDDLRI